MPLMLAIAEVSCAGMVDLVSFGIVNAAMMRMIVTTINSSMRVNPRSRLRLRIVCNLSRGLKTPKAVPGETKRCGGVKSGLSVSLQSKLFFSPQLMSKGVAGWTKESEKRLSEDGKMHGE